MNIFSIFISRHLKTLVVVGVVTSVYFLARLPQLPGAERARLASQFRFTSHRLPELQNYSPKYLRTVHKDLEHFSAWISAVGAGVALNDLDGDGLPNDLCYIDTRIDKVIVAQVPGTSLRYEPFALEPTLLPYDPNTTAPMGSLPGDFNEDGLTDILVYYWGRSPVIFLRRDVQDASHALPMTPDQYAPCELAAGGERWYTNAATQADLDGDGHVDLLIGNYFPDGSRILDANADGHEHMQHSMSRAFNGGRERFLLWRSATKGPTPQVQFEDVNSGLEPKLLTGWTLAVGAADLDGDLLPEIYLANDFGPDRLLHNLSRPGQLRFQELRGERTLTTPGSKVLGRDSFKGMGTEFGDLNGDGLLDICVSNIAGEYALEESHFFWLSTGKVDRMGEGVAPYVDYGESLGLSRSSWGWDVRLGDFNNDGILEVLQATGFLKGVVNRWPELHELAMGNDQLLSSPSSWPSFHPGDDLSGHGHNPFFVRAHDGRYYDLAAQVGLDQPHVSRGIATADVDGDGRLDFAVANQWESSFFYHNEIADAGPFLGLRLILPLPDQAIEQTIDQPGYHSTNKKGRPAIGAEATVYLPDGRRLVAQVDGGSGHSGKKCPDLHFGLGPVSAQENLRVVLRWRDWEGNIRQQTLYLSQGWHTVQLG